ncbi:alpha/beta hydrolase family protein [Alicyclobacillus dauci]|uniref:Alpha/beta fold hydrolase n=1 Tax=Alicyclobacillus dauci TaxID=1475485 RepID=A0ABY6Z5Q1_9BACL|nr:alpha/beta fold hydrolase [Alicyclobacillus dauci]WAH38228.1 alpha/beta fold hydrolase [Alicyclobacillus dauci]
MHVSRHVYGDQTFQFADLRVPDGEGPYPAIILIHGGFWRSRYSLDLMNDMAVDLTRRGYVTWNIEYRRVGHKGGGWPGTVQDVAAAIDHLDTLAGQVEIDLGRLGVVGHSAGGHLALWQAARAKRSFGAEEGLGIKKPLVQPTSIVSLAGVSDLRHMHQVRRNDSPVQAFMGGTPDELPGEYLLASPIELLPLGVPQLLVHGTEDENVPYEQSVSYVEAAERAGDSVDLLTLEGTDHFAVIDPTSDVWALIVEHVMKLVPLSR